MATLTQTVALQAADAAAWNLQDEGMTRDLQKSDSMHHADGRSIQNLQQALSYFAKFEAGSLNDTACERALEGVPPVVRDTHLQLFMMRQQLVLEKPVRIL